MCTSVRSNSKKRKVLASDSNAAALATPAKKPKPQAASASKEPTPLMQMLLQMDLAAASPGKGTSAEAAGDSAKGLSPAQAAKGMDRAEALPAASVKAASAEVGDPSKNEFQKRAEAQLHKLGYDIENTAPETVWQQLKQLRLRCDEVALNRCNRCKQELKDLKVQSKGKTSPCMICDRCNRGSVMLARHMVWPSKEFLKIDSQAQDKFWEECGELQTAPNGQDIGLSWDRLRECLKKALAKNQVKMQETRTSEGGSFQPLSYYENKGYDVEAIENNSTPQNKQWHSVLNTWTYRLAIVSVHYADILQSIENHISELEDKKKEKKASSRKASLEEDEASVELAKPMDEKELEKHQQKLRLQAANEQKKQEKEEEKQMKKLQKEVSSHNTAVTSLATKSRTALGKAELQAQKLLKDPKIDLVPACFIQKLQGYYDTISDYRAQCDNVFSAVKKASEKGTKLTALTFTKDTLLKLLKESEESASAMGKMLALMV